MRNETRELYNQFCDNIAELNGVADASKKFAVDPTIQQKLIDKKQESSEFLSKINVVPVPEMSGALLGLSVGSPIASNTDTSGSGERQTVSPSSMDGITYQCRQNNSDTHLPYAKLDMWAKFPDFETRIQNQIVRRQALDMMMIGFNGTTWSATSNPTTYPLRQDVNIGWLQKLRTDRPAQVLSAGSKVAGKLTYGPGGDYATLDALVWDLVQGLLPAWAVDDPDLVVIVGRNLLHDKYFPMINGALAPTEQMARDVIMSTKRLGNLPAATVPYFPNGKVMITRYDNLSVYEQEDKRRRNIIDNPKRDRVEDFQSSNDAYVIEDYDFACLGENIEYKA